MTKLIATILILLMVACGPADSPTWRPSEELGQRAAGYVQLLPDVQDPAGFVDTDRCDSLLFSALTAVGANQPIDIREAQLPDGQWLRRPVSYPECFQSGQSASTISRDMLLGVFWYGWHFRDLDLLESTWQHLERNNFVAGEGERSRTQVNPVLLGTLAQLIHRLGGPDRAVRLTPAVWAPVDGYERHLQVMHVMLRWEAGLESLVAAAAIKRAYEQDKQNVLFGAAYARIGGLSPYLAEKKLLESKWHFPDRLATSSDRCEEWVTQRNPNDIGLLPCPEQGRIHSPGDWLFAYRLLAK
jgi:hypothetical protein